MKTTEAGDIRSGFQHLHVVQFHETDAAGVVYFANLLTICHGAYEAALAASGIEVARFFSRENDVAVPVVHAEVDFFQPMRCGEAIAIHLIPTQLSAHSFEIRYKVCQTKKASANPLEPSAAPVGTIPFNPTNKTIAHALTRHVCIDPQSRQRHELTAELARWMVTLSGPIAPPD